MPQSLIRERISICSTLNEMVANMPRWGKKIKVTLTVLCILAVTWMASLQLYVPRFNVPADVERLTEGRRDIKVWPGGGQLQEEEGGGYEEKEQYGHIDVQDQGNRNVKEWAGSWRNLTELEVTKMSELGRRMFLEESIVDDIKQEQTNQAAKKYLILVWKHGKSLANRFIHRYTKKTFDPFEGCSVSNCVISYNDTLHLASADAVMFHLHRTEGISSLPATTSGTRPRHQRWVFMYDEAPFNAFLSRSKNPLPDYDGVFNWSMSYRVDADVPVPYGRTLRLIEDEQLKDNNVAQNKTKLAAILGSNCGGANHRWKYIKMLQEHMAIDVYGKCGTLKCAGHYANDCPALSSYKFYLAFENSNCADYVTEKAWNNAYNHQAVPVVMGASPHDCRRTLPPGSYIHTEDFESPRELAEFLMELDRDDKRYNEYFKWRQKFQILNEHGYFAQPVFHYCRLCQALNYNSREEKIYDKMQDVLNSKRDCYTQSWKLG